MAILVPSSCGQYTRKRFSLSDNDGNEFRVATLFRLRCSQRRIIVREHYGTLYTTSVCVCVCTAVVAGTTRAAPCTVPRGRVFFFFCFSKSDARFSGSTPRGGSQRPRARGVVRRVAPRPARAVRRGAPRPARGV